jgi:hypothetical protein
LACRDSWRATNWKRRRNRVSRVSGYWFSSISALQRESV